MKIIIVCICVILAIVDARILPGYLPKFCPKSDKDYSECTKNVLQKLGPYLVKGVRQLNFPKLEPLEIPLLIVNRTLNDNANLNAVYKDLKLWGLGKAVLKDFQFDISTLSGRLHLFVPIIREEGYIRMGGRLSVLVLDNEGYNSGNFCV